MAAAVAADGQWLLLDGAVTWQSNGLCPRSLLWATAVLRSHPLPLLWLVFPGTSRRQCCRRFSARPVVYQRVVSHQTCSWQCTDKKAFEDIDRHRVAYLDPELPLGNSLLELLWPHTLQAHHLILC